MTHPTAAGHDEDGVELRMEVTGQNDWRDQRWYAQESDIGGPCVTAGPTSPLEAGGYMVADMVRTPEIAEYIADLHNARLDTPRSTSARVIVVVDWRRQRVHGLTTDQAEAKRWCRDVVNRHGGDPLAATMTAGLVDHQPQPVNHSPHRQA
jgi:hypothetical protein